MFGAIDAALKATEEVAAAAALLTQQAEPAQAVATSHGAASPGSSQSGAASDKLYGSSPDRASKAQPAGASPPKEHSMAVPQDEQAAVPDPSTHDHAAADLAGEDCLLPDRMLLTFIRGSEAISCPPVVTTSSQVIQRRPRWQDT